MRTNYFKKVNPLKLLAASLSITLSISVYSQSVVAIKTATLIPFIDVNNNCVKDPGEMLVNSSGEVFCMKAKKYRAGYSDDSYYNNSGYGATTGPEFYGSNDTLFGSFLFFNSLNALALNKFSIYTWDFEDYLQPCFNPNNIAFNTITYVPFKSTFIGRACAPRVKSIFNRITRNFSFKGSSFCKTDSVSFELEYTLGAQQFASTPSLSTAPQTVTVSIDGTVIDTYNYTNTISGGTILYGVNTELMWTFNNSSGITSYGISVRPKSTFQNTLSAGSHTVTITHTPILGLTQSIIQNYEFILSNNCPQISGTSFLDCNNNCFQDGTELYKDKSIQSIRIENQTNQSFIYPDALGNFNIGVPPGTYTVSAHASTGYSICNISTNTIVVAPLSPQTIINYGLTQTNIIPDDFYTYFGLSGGDPVAGAVPGGTITITVWNNKSGGDACASTVFPGKLKVILPPLMSFNSVYGSTSAPSSIISSPTGDTIVWDTPLTFDWHAFSVITATNAIIGTPYCVTAIINPLADGVPANNKYSFCRNYGGPFDPNDKTAEAINMDSNGNILPNTQEITYTIRCQNLGNGPAVDVIMKDTIDANLDLASLKIIDSSYPVVTQVNKNSREVTFSLRNIYLQGAAINEPASHGFVRYKINLNNALPIGTTLKNRAHIYFDYNSAVSTNQTVNKIAIATGINTLKLNNDIYIYPNPTTNNININSSTTLLKAEVLNAIGQVVFAKNNINANVITIDLSTLSHGIYIVQLQTSNGMISEKIIKE